MPVPPSSAPPLSFRLPRCQPPSPRPRCACRRPPPASIAALEASLAGGTTTCRAVTEAALARIRAVERGPNRPRAVLETNPDALAIADALDAVQWSTDRLRPLHCVTLLAKDDYETADKLHTTVGSLTMLGFRATRDAASSRACAALARSCSGRRTWTSGPTVRRAARRAAGNDRRTARAAGSVQPPARRAEHLGPPVQAGGRGLVPWPGRRRAGRLPGRDRRREPPAAGGWQGADPREREPRTEGAGAARPDLRPVACRRTAALLPPDSGLPVLSVPGPAMPGNQRVGNRRAWSEPELIRLGSAFERAR